MKKTFIRQANLPREARVYDLEFTLSYYKQKALEKRKAEQHEHKPSQTSK